MGLPAARTRGLVWESVPDCSCWRFAPPHAWPCPVRMVQGFDPSRSVSECLVPLGAARKNVYMATTAFKGTPVTTVGELPTVGQPAPTFDLVGTDLIPVTRESLPGRIVLNIFPSIDTGVCAQSVRTFNEKAAGLEAVSVLCVSNDLPFAQSRFCGAEGIENVTVASGFRSTFGDDFGVTMSDGPLSGLLARSIVVLDEDGTVVHTQLVDDIASEPDYSAALDAAQGK